MSHPGRTKIQDPWKISAETYELMTLKEGSETVLMNGDSGDVNYLGDPLLYSRMSSLRYLPYLRGH